MGHGEYISVPSFSILLFFWRKQFSVLEDCNAVATYFGDVVAATTDPDKKGMQQKMFEKLKEDMMSLKRDMTATRPGNSQPGNSKSGKSLVARRRRGTSLGYSSREERVFTRSRASLGSSEEANSRKRLYEEMSDDDDEGQEAHMFCLDS